MRYLIYGAGNIGSLYAARLAQGSNEVAILARGTRLEQIREHGIELEDGVSGERITAHPEVVTRLEPDDAYDVVLVILPRHRVVDVLPVLAANQHTPSIMFFGNSAAGPDAMVDAIGRDRVLLGFPGAAAVPHDDAIRYIITSKLEQPTTIGELDGSRSHRITSIESALHEAGFPTAVCPDMDAWLKTHVAKILPTVCALFQAGGQPEMLANDDAALRSMVRSILEGYRVLRAIDVPITPGNQRVLEWLPESLLVFLMRRMLSDEKMAIKVGHAEKGRAEWLCLAEEFRALIERAGVPTPEIDAGYRQLSSPRDER